MKSKEKLPLETNNMNSVNYRPETVNTTSGDARLTSKEAGNEVRNAIKNFEQSLVNENNLG